MHIRNPIEWLLSAPAVPASELGAASPAEYWNRHDAATPRIRHATADDIRYALARGIEDFEANRTDVITLAVVYPIIGLLLAAASARGNILPLIFPLVSGFALIGPFAAIWFYEVSRRRENGENVTILDALGVLRSPQIGAITGLGCIQIILFLLWIFVADRIYLATLGPAMPASAGIFAREMFTTGPGWIMIVGGIAAGFVFAMVALTIGTLSFPLLLDRSVPMGTAIRTSARALYENPRVLGLWGGIVAVSLIIGSLPALLGLVVVLPILGHATWHLYRRIVY